MGFFDKLSDVINSTSKEINKKAKDLMSSNKLEGQIAAEEDKIQSIYLQIGMEYYAACKDDPECTYAQLCQQIDAARKEISKLKKELEKLKGLQRCPNCGSAVSVDAAFCPKCGTKMPTDEPVAAEKKEEVPLNEKAENVVEDVKDKVEDVVESVLQQAEEMIEKVEDKIEDLTEKEEE